MAAITRTACCAVSCRCWAAGKPALVRIPVGRFDMASRALDFGAEAVIAPMVNSVADAQLLCRRDEIPAARRALLGPDLCLSAPRQGRLRRLAARHQQPHRGLRHGRDARRARCARRHSRHAGIDGIFLGPSDFSIAWSDGATINSTLEDMMETVASVAERAAQGRQACGDLSSSIRRIAGRFVAMGYRCWRWAPSTR